RSIFRRSLCESLAGAPPISVFLREEILVKLHL
ncbi:hypothetical protein CCACVL1_12579, partial [Corchorus capsularis]